MNQNTATAVFIGLMLLWTIDLSAQNLSVTLLGTGSPIPIVDRFGPSTLIQAGDETLLFDCGRGVPLRLWQLQIPLRNVTAVFFTHLHSDHVAGFPDFWLTGWLPPPFGHRTERLHVYGPTGTANMMKHLQKAYKADIRIRIAGPWRPIHCPKIPIPISAGLRDSSTRAFSVLIVSIAGLMGDTTTGTSCSRYRVGDYNSTFGPLSQRLKQKCGPGVDLGSGPHLAKMERTGIYAAFFLLA